MNFSNLYQTFKTILLRTIPKISADSGHKSETLNTNFDLKIFLSTVHLYPKIEG